jgi:hypothetical protein
LDLEVKREKKEIKEKEDLKVLKGPWDKEGWLELQDLLELREIRDLVDLLDLLDKQIGKRQLVLITWSQTLFNMEDLYIFLAEMVDIYHGAVVVEELHGNI